METTVGRLIFNEIVPDKIGFVNEEMNSKKLKDLVAKTLNTYENDYTVEFLDKLKKLGYETITYSGLSWGMNDVPTLKEKKEIIKVTPSSPPPLRSMKPQLRGSIVVKPSEKEIGLSALRKDVSKPNTSSSPVEQKKV